MSKSVKYVAAAIIVAAIVAAGAGLLKSVYLQEPEPAYELPVRAEDFEALMDETGLDWQIVDDQSFYEGHSVISIVNDPEVFGNDSKVFCTVESFKFSNGGRSLRMSFHLGPGHFVEMSDMVRDFNAEYMSDIISMAGTLYGRPKEMDRAYREMLRSIDKCATVNGTKYWTKRAGDNHYVMSMSVIDDDSGQAYSMRNMKVMNTAANEQFEASRENMFTSEYGSYDLTYGTVQDVAQAKPPAIVDINEEKAKAIAVTGTITNLRRKDGLMYGELNDDTGSTTVIINPSSTMNAEEFGQVRRHYITYNHDVASVGMVYLSVLPSVKLLL